MKKSKIRAKRGVLPEVSRLLRKYKPKRGSDRIGRPAERGLERIAILDRILCGNPGRRAIATPERQVELRSELLKLEAWVRQRSSRGV